MTLKTILDHDVSNSPTPNILKPPMEPCLTGAEVRETSEEASFPILPEHPS